MLVKPMKSLDTVSVGSSVERERAFSISVSYNNEATSMAALPTSLSLPNQELTKIDTKI